MNRRTRRLATTLAGMAVLSSLVAAGPSVGPGDRQGEGRQRPTAEGVSEVQYHQFIVEALEVETTHGILRGEVKRPVVEDGVTVPIILVVSPYGVLNESLSTYNDVENDATSRYFTPRGYAFATFDAIGTHASGGCTDFGGLGERESTAQLVDHLGGLEWSNGKVGMIGGSYDGTLAIAAAVEAPEHLVTIVPQVAIDRWYDYMFNQGVRMFFEDVSGEGGAIPADPPGDSPIDYDTVYGLVPDPTKDPLAIASATSEHAQPCNRVENQTRGYEQDPLYDEFWIERDYRALAQNVRASVLFEGAWLDDNVKHWAATRFFQALPDDLPKRLVIGQWTHSTSRFGDAMAIRHAWFDHFLLGLDTKILRVPRVDSQSNDGQRRQSHEWPPAGTVETTFALDDTGFAPTADGSWIDADPTIVEERLGEGDCAPICAVFRGPTFDEPVRVVGAPRLEITATTDATSTHVTPILVDVSPNGDRRIITRGLLNTRNRDGLDIGTDLVPGQPWTGTVELWDLDQVIEAGHHLELVLSSTNATFGIADHTRATTVLDEATTRLVLPLHADPEQDVVTEF